MKNNVNKKKHEHDYYMPNKNVCGSNNNNNNSRMP